MEPRFCKACGAPLLPDDQFCGDCGAPVSLAQQASQPAPDYPPPSMAPHTTPQAGGKNRVPLIVVSCVAAVALIVTGIVFLPKLLKKDNSQNGEAVEAIATPGVTMTPTPAATPVLAPTETAVPETAVLSQDYLQGFWLGQPTPQEDGSLQFETFRITGNTIEVRYYGVPYDRWTEQDEGILEIWESMEWEELYYPRQAELILSENEFGYLWEDGDETSCLAEIVDADTMRVYLADNSWESLQYRYKGIVADDPPPQPAVGDAGTATLSQPYLLGAWVSEYFPGEMCYVYEFFADGTCYYAEAYPPDLSDLNGWRTGAWDLDEDSKTRGYYEVTDAAIDFTWDRADEPDVVNVAQVIDHNTFNMHYGDFAITLKHFRVEQ